MEPLIGVVQAKIGSLIQKPKMTEKLLSKPPFRFLHDTISAVISTTGFGEGLYSGDELDSAAITDKQAKIAYLEKIFNLVGICTGSPLDVRAVKVVAGLEPENTNAFLSFFADCAVDATLDSATAVQRCLTGGVPDGNIPRKAGGAAAPVAAQMAESKADREEAPVAKQVPRESKREDPPKVESKREEPPMERGFESKNDAPTERGTSRGGTRGGKPSQATADVGLRGAVSGNAQNLDAFIERCDGAEETTQSLLGDVITRPKLTPKLLGKPPFRFLHDIVMEVIRVTGFATGLYTDDELDSSKVADKTQKMGFLEKIIKTVGIQLNTMVEAKPAKIVAGLDPMNTNTFLQLLAIAAKYAPDSRQAVALALGQEAPPTQAPVPAPAPAASEGRRMSRDVRGDKGDDSMAARPKSRQPVHDSGALDRDNGFGGIEDRPSIAEAKPMLDEAGMGAGGDENPDVKRSARPTTARRRPPKVKDGAKEVTAKETAPNVKKTEGILIDGANDDDDDDDVADETRLADQAESKMSSVGPSGATADGQPQSKLVKDILSRQAEQEALAKGDADTKQEDTSTVQGGTGIRLGRAKLKAGSNAKSPTTAVGDTDVERIRNAVQVLVQHTGPLGTCMDFIQEDVGLMSSELHRWEEECRRYDALALEEQRKTKQMLQPLQAQLADLEEEIGEKIARISTIKASIGKNDERIEQSLKMMMTA
jgi:TRAF3-interacting protein 1